MGMIRASLVAVALGLPSLVQADPSYHRVTGVAAQDTLNVRAAPSADSEDIGDLAHDAQMVEVLGFDANRDWARISLAERDGWVAARFLAPDSVVTIGDSAIPVGLSCTGTEPFWGLSLSADAGTYSQPAEPDASMAVTQSRVAEGRSGSPLYLRLSGDDYSATAIVSGTMCSDGMSDRSYGWTINARITGPDADRFVTGCCHLPRK